MSPRRLQRAACPAKPVHEQLCLKPRFTEPFRLPAFEEAIPECCDSGRSHLELLRVQILLWGQVNPKTRPSPELYTLRVCVPHHLTRCTNGPGPEGCPRGSCREDDQPLVWEGLASCLFLKICSYR